ncbi:MAG: DUF523 domain-containing protein [Candidatus Aenigmarchaeota archaeon]|nr:DUF523 domain-containing protein [Candidatus Aenigmarchaeota archaeon]
MYIVSACLAGINCNYKGVSKPNKKVIELVKRMKAIPVCPEVLAGQTIPRPNAKIDGGTGMDVLEGKARVIEADGNDVTKLFIKGAFEVLKITQAINAKEAILKARSPSCGCDGVTTALLKRNGIKVYTEENFK